MDQVLSGEASAGVSEGKPRQRPGVRVVVGSAALWILWCAVILAATVLPLSEFRGHSHWYNVNWIPFGEPRVKAFDVIGNVLLFVPFGAWGPFGTGRRRVAAAALSALVLSMSIEYYQVFCHSHFPSATDVVNNVAGAALGARLVHATVTRSMARRTAS